VQEIVKGIVERAKTGDKVAIDQFFRQVLGSDSRPTAVHNTVVVTDVETAARLGQAAVGEGAEDLDPRARFVEGDAHLTVMGDRRILDDGDVHETAPVWQRPRCPVAVNGVPRRTTGYRAAGPPAHHGAATATISAASPAQRRPRQASTPTIASTIRSALPAGTSTVQ
jgi:hypothetical protein